MSSVARSSREARPAPWMLSHSAQQLLESCSSGKQTRSDACSPRSNSPNPPPPALRNSEQLQRPRSQRSAESQHSDVSSSSLSRLPHRFVPVAKQHAREVDSRVQTKRVSHSISSSDVGRNASSPESRWMTELSESQSCERMSFSQSPPRGSSTRVETTREVPVRVIHAPFAEEGREGDGDRYRTRGGRIDGCSTGVPKTVHYMLADEDDEDVELHCEVNVPKPTVISRREERHRSDSNAPQSRTRRSVDSQEVLERIRRRNSLSSVRSSDSVERLRSQRTDTLVDLYRKAVDHAAVLEREVRELRSAVGAPQRTEQTAANGRSTECSRCSSASASRSASVDHGGSASAALLQLRDRRIRRLEEELGDVSNRLEDVTVLLEKERESSAALKRRADDAEASTERVARQLQWRESELLDLENENARLRARMSEFSLTPMHNHDVRNSNGNASVATSSLPSLPAASFLLPRVLARDTQVFNALTFNCRELSPLHVVELNEFIARHSLMECALATSQALYAQIVLRPQLNSLREVSSLAVLRKHHDALLEEELLHIRRQHEDALNELRGEHTKTMEAQVSRYQRTTHVLRDVFSHVQHTRRQLQHLFRLPSWELLVEASLVPEDVGSSLCDAAERIQAAYEALVQWVQSTRSVVEAGTKDAKRS